MLEMVFRKEWLSLQLLSQSNRGPYIFWTIFKEQSYMLSENMCQVKGEESNLILNYGKNKNKQKKCVIWASW